MKKRDYLKTKKKINKDVKLFKKYIKLNNDLVTPASEFGLIMALDNLRRLNDNYKRKINGRG